MHLVWMPDLISESFIRLQSVHIICESIISMESIDCYYTWYICSCIEQGFFEEISGLKILVQTAAINWHRVGALLHLFKKFCKALFCPEIVVLNCLCSQPSICYQFANFINMFYLNLVKLVLGKNVSSSHMIW